MTHEASSPRGDCPKESINLVRYRAEEFIAAATDDSEHAETLLKEALKRLEQALNQVKSAHVHARLPEASSHPAALPEADAPHERVGDTTPGRTAPTLSADVGLRLFCQLTDQLNDAILVVEPRTGRILDSNDTGARVLGYSHEELCNLRVADLDLVMRDSSRWVEHLRIMRQTGSHTSETTLRRKDGTTFLVEVSVSYAVQYEREYLIAVIRDVTGRKKMEQQIFDREQQYRMLVENIPDFIVRYDTQLRRTYVNPAWERASGLSAAEVLNRPAEANKRVPHPAIDEYVDKLRETMRTGTPQIIEFSWTNAHGALLDLEYTITPEFAPDGTVIGALSIGHDITERKQIERERQAHLRFLESMDRINRAIQGTSDVDEMMSAVLDVVLATLDCDRAYFVYPCDPDALTWYVPMERTKPEYPGAAALGGEFPINPDVADAFRAVLSSPRPVAYGQGDAPPIPDVSRNQFGVRAQLAMAVYPRGGKPYMVGVHQCSRERIWTVEEIALFEAIGQRLSDALTIVLSHRDLRASEQRFRALVEQAADPFFLIDCEGQLLDVNQSACDCLGFTRDELLTMNAVDIDTKVIDQRHKQRFWDPLRPGEPVTFESRHRCKDGTTYPVEMRLGVLILDGERLILGLARDISERKKAEEEKQQLASQLYHAQKLDAVGQLAGGVAHDFNNLLTVISGSAELMETKLVENDPAQQFLRNIMAAARQAAGVTRSLLTFSRRVPVEMERIELREHVRKAVHLLHRMMPAAVSLVTDPWDLSPVWLSADGTQLQQVIINLAINARDSMPSGGTLRLTVNELAGAEAEAAIPDLSDIPGATGRVAQLIVSDTGAGMPPEVRDRVFEPFFTTKSRGQGTGLGLSIVHGIIQEHRGVIHIDSAPDEGTTVTIHLPVCVCEGQDKEEEAALGAVRAQGELVLLAEDNPSVRRVIVTALEMVGFRVLEAVDGAVLMDRFEKHRDELRLFILDVDLPKRSGLDCLKAIRTDGVITPAIVVTGGEEAAIEYERDPHTLLLRKPFAQSMLQQLAKQALSGSFEQDAHHSSSGPSVKG